MSDVTAAKIIGIEWHDGKNSYESDYRGLAVCFDVGRVQIMKHYNDECNAYLTT